MLRWMPAWRNAEELIWLLPLSFATIGLFLVSLLTAAPYRISVAALVGEAARMASPTVPAAIGILVIVLLVQGLVSGSPQPLVAALDRCRARFGSPMLAAAAIAPVLMMPVLFGAFCALKTMLPWARPFAWDDSFAAIGRAMFLGQQPWEITHALLGRTGTVILDRFYSAWVFLLALSVPAFAVFGSRYDRARFMLSFVAAWIVLGVVAAYLGSSAGPCFADRLGLESAPRFAGLMAQLNSYSALGAQLNSLDWQNVLWDAHVHRRVGLGMGISAMPSLHIAISTLYALAFFRAGRIAGIAATLFALTIFVGSIHLGWHYAADGLIAAPAMALLWWAAGRYLDWSGYRAAVEAGAPSGPKAMAAKGAPGGLMPAGA